MHLRLIPWSVRVVCVCCVGFLARRHTHKKLATYRFLSLTLALTSVLMASCRLKAASTVAASWPNASPSRTCIISSNQDSRREAWKFKHTEAVINETLTHEKNLIVAELFTFLSNLSASFSSISCLGTAKTFHQKQFKFTRRRVSAWLMPSSVHCVVSVDFAFTRFIKITLSD